MSAKVCFKTRENGLQASKTSTRRALRHLVFSRLTWSLSKRAFDLGFAKVVAGRSPILSLWPTIWK